jgi:hypothetical protein
LGDKAAKFSFSIIAPIPVCVMGLAQTEKAFLHALHVGHSEGSVTLINVILFAGDWLPWTQQYTGQKAEVVSRV